MNPPRSTSPKPFVFVLMPFKADFDDVFTIAIKDAAEMAGAYAERVDTQHFVEAIPHRILNQISKADLLIADVTGKNPNVFYEIGYAHALNKPVIFITQSREDLPFDVRYFHHTEYKLSELARLRDTLAAKVREAIAAPSLVHRPGAPCPFVLRGNGLDLPEKEPCTATVMLTQSSTMAPTLHLAWRNVHSASPISVHEVYLLPENLDRKDLIIGDSDDDPVWWDAPADRIGGFAFRYRIDLRNTILRQFGVVEAMVRLRPRNTVLPFATFRVETLTDRGSFAHYVKVQFP